MLVGFRTYKVSPTSYMVGPICSTTPEAIPLRMVAISGTFGITKSERTTFRAALYVNSNPLFRVEQSDLEIMVGGQSVDGRIHLLHRLCRHRNVDVDLACCPEHSGVRPMGLVLFDDPQTHDLEETALVQIEVDMLLAYRGS